MTKPSHTTESGFALLFTIVIVSIVLAVGLAILDFTIKQIVLSSVTRDSEIAFHMSNAGFECIKFLREADPAGYDSLDSSAQNCAGGSDVAASPAVPGSDIEGFIFEFDDASTQRCSVVRLLVADAVAAGAAIDDSAIRAAAADPDMELPMPSTGNYTCPAGSICNYIFSIGSNRSCSATGVGVIQREIFGRF